MICHNIREKGTEEKERPEREYDATKSMKEEKAIDKIWGRFNKLKEMQEIEERVQRAKETQPEVTQPKEIRG